MSLSKRWPEAYCELPGSMVEWVGAATSRRRDCPHGSASRALGCPQRALCSGNEVKTLLEDAMLVPTVAVTDLDRAKRFFGEQLGLSLLDETPFAIRYAAGKGTQVSVRRGQPNAGQTVAHFEVDDLEGVIRDLTKRGITFEEYESPKTTNFIAEIGPARGAWFKDPDGNVFGLRQGPVPGVS